MFNQVILIGNLGKDPEVKVLPNGTKVVEFSLATTESWKDKGGEKQSKTEWHDICSFQANFIELSEKFLKKGSKCQIIGKIKYNTYEKDGVKRKNTKIDISSLLFLDSKEKAESNENIVVEMVDDEIDF